MAEPLPGWSAPVFAGMTDAPLLHGVPMIFFAFNMLGTLFVALCLVPVSMVYAAEAVLGGSVLYLLMLLGMKIEPRWCRILREYCAYAHFYEG